MTCDFSGWATRNDLLCADGRTILKDAFKECDGKTVPLVWMHNHSSPNNVLGHAVLENRDSGVYAYCTFNDTESAKAARELVKHGDIDALSIYANGLKQKNGAVNHGTIREVSLVLSGANPGAKIEFPVLAHGEDVNEIDEAVIYTDELLYLSHAAPDDKDEEETPKKKEEPKVADNEKQAGGGKTVGDVLESMTDEQKKVLYYLIGEAVKDAKGGKGSDDGADDNDEEEKPVKHNVFEGDTPENSLSHADVTAIFADAKRCGSLRDAVQNAKESGVLAHAVYNTNADGTQGAQQTYGIANIDYLFPDVRQVGDRPTFIQRDMDWVGVVMRGVHHTPFSRIKSVYANITMDEARARGYVKGNMKKDEVFSLLKRTTTPQTVYKKQRLDRDDIIDITDFDVVAWIKSEMRMMLDEEFARAYLIGDGRLNSDDDKIKEDNIRPIATDADLYNIKCHVPTGTTNAKTAKNVIRYAVKARKDYKGKGNPTFFTTEDWLTEMLLLEDRVGHRLYKSEAEVATAMRVSSIVTVPVMENITINGEALIGIIVNLQDYNVGADKGGAVEMFDDFDIDYNQQKYLIEARCSGALITPYSAITLTQSSTVSDPDEPVPVNVVNYPTTEEDEGEGEVIGG